MKRSSFYFKMVTGALLRKRSRMLVALLAIAVGATIVSGLMTIYYDIPRQLTRELRSYGANMVVTPADGTKLTYEEIESIRALLPAENTVGTAPYRYETVTLNSQPVTAAGTQMNEAAATSPYWNISGEWAADDSSIMLGSKVAQLVNAKVGQDVELEADNGAGEGVKNTYTVSGIVETGGSEENFIFMTDTALDFFMGDTDSFDTLECSISLQGDELTVLAERINSSSDRVNARLVKRVTESEGTVLTKLQALILIVTIVIIVLTMISVATTMTAVVTERRREIGLKKAIGASNREITTEFLGQGIFLGVCGGILGIVLGFLFAQYVSNSVFFRSVSFIWGLVPVTILSSVAVTAVACLIPMRSATNIDPALVLKGE